MSRSITVSDALIDVAALVSAGDQAAAKRQMRELLDVAESSDLVIIGRCATTLERYPYRIALEKLRNAWLHTHNEGHRALIAACAPPSDAGQYLPATEPERAPRYGKDNYQAPRNSHTRIDPARRTKREQRQRREESATVTAYMQERAGIDDAPERGERPDGYAIDYDKAGVPDMRGLPCVSCWLERAAADQATTRVHDGHGDDGLCGQCRESGRPGIPELPTGHTRADAIEARCAFIAARTGAAARRILRREWRRGITARDRSIVAAWVQTHPLPETPSQHAPKPQVPVNAAPAHEDSTAPNPPASDEACEQCGGIRQIRDAMCLDCRRLDTPPSPTLSNVDSTSNTDETERVPVPA